MACTLPLFENGNLLANCHRYAGTDRVCGYKRRSWSVTDALAGGIRGVGAYRGCSGEPGPAPGREHGTPYPTSLLPRARPTTAYDGDELAAVPEAALGGLGHNRPWLRGGRDTGIWPLLTYDHDAEYMSVNHCVESLHAYRPEISLHARGKQASRESVMKRPRLRTLRQGVPRLRLCPQAVHAAGACRPGCRANDLLQVSTRNRSTHMA